MLVKCIVTYCFMLQIASIHYSKTMDLWMMNPAGLLLHGSDSG